MKEWIYDWFREDYPGIEITPHDQEIILKTIFIFLDLQRKFESNYINNTIIESINLTYPALDSHVKSIIDGKIIKNRIQNPLLLLRNTLYHFYKNDKKSSFE